jgi:hypothetical protein
MEYPPSSSDDSNLPNQSDDESDSDADFLREMEKIKMKSRMDSHQGLLEAHTSRGAAVTGNFGSKEGPTHTLDDANFKENQLIQNEPVELPSNVQLSWSSLSRYKKRAKKQRPEQSDGLAQKMIGDQVGDFH